MNEFSCEAQDLAVGYGKAPLAEHITLGVRPEQSVEFFLGGLPGRYRMADGPCRLQGALFTLDSSTGLCAGVERIEIQ